MDCGTNVCTAAAMNAPSTRKRAMNTTSPLRCPANRRQRGSARSTASRASAVLGARAQQLPAPLERADHPAHRHGHHEPQHEPTDHHQPERVAAAVGHERRRDHDRVHDRRREHERDGGPGRQALSMRGAVPPAPTRIRRPGTPCRPPPRPGAGSREGACRSARTRWRARSTSIAAETAAPSRMNGIASTRSEPNTISRFCSHATRLGCARWTAPPARAARPARRGRTPRAVGVRGDLRARRSDVDGHQQYRSNATEKPG